MRDIYPAVAVLIAIMFGLVFARMVAAMLVGIWRLIVAEIRWRRMLRSVSNDVTTRRAKSLRHPRFPGGTLSW
jgi:hypothetical protein